MTNWRVGIDHGSSVPGGLQIALAANFFIETKSGDNANAGTPGAAKQTMDGATASPGGFVISNSFWNLSSGVYTSSKVDFAYQPNRLTVRGNGRRYSLLNNFDNRISDSAVIFYNNVIIKSRIWNGTRNRSFDNCILEGLTFQITPTNAVTSIRQMINTTVINSTINFRRLGSNQANSSYLIRNCSLYGVNLNLNVDNSTAELMTIQFENCYFDDACTFVLNDDIDTAASYLKNCRFTFTQVNGSTPTNLIPQIDCITSSSLTGGDPVKYELYLPVNSPLIGAGLNNKTIGNFNVGRGVSLTSPAENNNITAGAIIELSGVATAGNIKPQYIVFNQVRKSPIVAFYGIDNDSVNVPKISATLDYPNYRKLQVTYRETAGGAEITKDFVYGLPMWKDSAGKTTGEDDFNWGDVQTITADNLINVKEMQPNFSLVDL